MTAAITQSPVIGSVTDIGPQSWAAVAADRFYSSYDWLRFCEQDASARLRHIVIRRDGTPSAAVPVHNVDAEPNPCYRWRNILADAGLPAPAGRYLLLGTRRGYQSHLLVDRRGGDRRGDVSALVAAAEELAAAEGMASIAALYVPTPDALDLVHARPGTCPVYLADDAWLELPGSGFDDYLDGLPAARRRKVCYEERRFATHRYRVSRTTLANCVDDATRLVAFTEARYQNAVDTAAIRFSFVRQAAVMGDAAEVLLLHDRQGVVGFCLYYLYGRSLYLRTVGFDYGRLRNAYEYFNLTYYLPIRIAYERGARSLHAGIKSSRAKALRGARLNPLWLVVIDPALAHGHDRIRRYNQARLHDLRRELEGNQAAVTHEHWTPFLMDNADR